MSLRTIAAAVTLAAASLLAPGTAQAAPALPNAPYVDMGAWPTPVLTEMRQATGVRGFSLGFITGAACKASWFAAFDPRTGWQREEVDAIRAAGGDVKISFGGASGVEIAIGCPDVASTLREYEAVVKAYDLTYMDLDIEGSAVQDRASVQRRSQALAQLQARYPRLKISLTLPVLPTGLTAAGLDVVRSAKAAGVDLDMVDIMAMDYYQGPADQGKKAIQAANSLHAQLKTVYPDRSDAALWKMVGVTPMIGVNDSRDEIFYQEDARELVAFARTRHLGMLSMWDTVRDRNACTGPLYRCTNISQQPYDFARILAGYTG